MKARKAATHTARKSEHCAPAFEALGNNRKSDNQLAVQHARQAPNSTSKQHDAARFRNCRRRNVAGKEITLSRTVFSGEYILQRWIVAQVQRAVELGVPPL